MGLCSHQLIILGALKIDLVSKFVFHSHFAIRFYLLIFCASVSIVDILLCPSLCRTLFRSCYSMHFRPWFLTAWSLVINYQWESFSLTLLYSFFQGNQCDFRHSEGARMNPRDCYYWLNGNCLNPKCSFRHPVILLFLYFPCLFTIRPLVISASNWHR